jgi:hypothetical protein
MPSITFRPLRRSPPSVMLFRCARRATADRVATRHPHQARFTRARPPYCVPRAPADHRDYPAFALLPSIAQLDVPRLPPPAPPQPARFRPPDQPSCGCSSLCLLLSARSRPRSASGLAINICDVLVEEGGPRVEAKRRGGDPLPRARCRAKSRERAGSRVVAWGGRLIDDHPRRPPKRPPCHSDAAP